MKIWINKATWISLIMLLSLPVYALKPVDTAIIELYQRIENLQHEVNSLRGTNEQLQKELDTLRKHQKEGLIDMDDRIQAIESKKKSESKYSNSKYTNKVIEKNNINHNDKKSKLKKESASKAAYQEAYSLLRENPSAGMSAFGRFLENYPSSPLAANAHYWMGETWYSRGKYTKAKEHFLVVLKDYKGSNKESDAALKLGYTFAATKEWGYAKQTLRDVIKFFPDTREAELAEKKLAGIRNK